MVETIDMVVRGTHFSSSLNLLTFPAATKAMVLPALVSTLIMMNIFMACLLDRLISSTASGVDGVQVYFYC